MLKFFRDKRIIWSAAAILGLVLLVLVNWFSIHWFHRFDLTDNHLYSLSLASQRTIRQLSNDVIVTAYLSKNLPPEFAALREQIIDLLKEYSNYNSRFRLTIKDTGDGKEAEAAGLPKLQFNDIRRDKLEVVNGYLGLVIEYKDKKELLALSGDLSSLEYELTSLIKRLTATELPILGWLASDQTTAGSFNLARETLSKIYIIKDLDWKKPEDWQAMSALLWLEPDRNYSDSELQLLNDYLLKGGSVVVLTETIEPDAALRPTANVSNISDWLNKWGIVLGEQLVLDGSSAIAFFNQGPLSYSVPYPFWPKTINANFDVGSPAVSGLDGVVLAWAVSVDSELKSSDKLRISHLAKSSSGSWLAPAGAPLSPENLPAAKNRQSYNLILGLSGELPFNKTTSTADSAHLIVVGDADFADDRFGQNNPANLALLSNLVDSVATGDELVAIRNKTIEARPIKDLSDADRLWWRSINVFGVPLLVLFFGVIRYYWRKRTKMIQF